MITIKNGNKVYIDEQLIFAFNSKFMDKLNSNLKFRPFIGKLLVSLNKYMSYPNLQLNLFRTYLKRLENLFNFSNIIVIDSDNIQVLIDEWSFTYYILRNPYYLYEHSSPLSERVKLILRINSNGFITDCVPSFERCFFDDDLIKQLYSECFIPFCKCRINDENEEKLFSNIREIYNTLKIKDTNFSLLEYDDEKQFYKVSVCTTLFIILKEMFNL